MSEHLCVGRVWSEGAMRSSQCRVRAKVERDGQHYCGRHDPVARKEKDDAKNAAEKASRDRLEVQRKAIADEKAEHNRKAACFDDLRCALVWLVETCASEGWPSKMEHTVPMATARAALAKATP